MADEDLPPEAFDIIVCACNLARFKQIKTTELLKAEVKRVMPEMEDKLINQALAYWAKRARATDAHLR